MWHNLVVSHGTRDEIQNLITTMRQWFMVRAIWLFHAAPMAPPTMTPTATLHLPLWKFLCYIPRNLFHVTPTSFPHHCHVLLTSCIEKHSNFLKFWIFPEIHKFQFCALGTMEIWNCVQFHPSTPWIISMHELWSFMGMNFTWIL
jgi:hypothetical protein